METLKPVVIEELKYNNNGYIIAHFKNLVTGKRFSAKGNMSNPTKGIEYTLSGRWQSDKRWGDTFTFKEYSSEAPKNLEAIRQYIRSNVKGIGYTYAGRLVEEWGENTLDKLRDMSYVDISLVTGISVGVCKELKEMLENLRDSEELSLKINLIFSGVRVPGKTKEKIIKDFGNSIFDELKINPYQLTKYKGISFLTADRIAKNLDVPHTSPFRIREGVIFSMEELAGEGHTKAPAVKFIYRTASTLEVDTQLVTDVMQDMIAKKDSLHLDEENDMVSLIHYRDSEKYIADKIKQILATPEDDVNWEDAFSKVDMSDLALDQKDALTKALLSKIFILTGAPGTGKTYSIKKLLYVYHSVLGYSQQDIALAAPTGKAAKRMYEQTGWYSSTIHKLLDPKYDEFEKRFYFERNKDFPLPHKLIILDEASMIDIKLMKSFLEAVKDDSKLIIIGDHYQLPSVGPGNVLRDLIAGGIPMVELTIIKRQDPGSIVTNCHRIKNGETVVIDKSPNTDLQGIYFKSEGHIQDCILKLITEDLPAKFKEAGQDIDPVWDIQVIAPYNKITELSCESLNELLQNKLNPEPFYEKTQYKLGDKVIQTKNDYQLGVINGDIGKVIDYTKEGREAFLVVEFYNPTREVSIDIMENNLKLAYCCTCHKFQGSEEKIVILPMYKGFSPKIMQRNWIYTAISRAVELCVIVGELPMLDGIVRRTESINRLNNLRDFLGEEDLQN